MFTFFFTPFLHSQSEGIILESQYNFFPILSHTKKEKPSVDAVGLVLYKRLWVLRLEIQGVNYFFSAFFVLEHQRTEHDTGDAE